MWEFLKKIFSKRDGDVTVMVLDENEPDLSSSFRFQSADMMKIVLMVVLVSVLFTTLIFFITPLGSLYQFQQESDMREEVIQISEQVQALRDSLIARDQQLAELKRVLVENPDTTFQTSIRPVNVEQELFASAAPGFGYSEMPAYEMLNQNEIIFSDILRQPPGFPGPFPVDGTLTQSFSPEDGHLGIDIAARERSEFRAIADGTVISAGWGIRYGYFVHLQHGDGFMSVYKHGASLFVEEGDIVLRGDILGTMGDKGALSFGSHLHLEIWKNGVAQDPIMYLIR